MSRLSLRGLKLATVFAAAGLSGASLPTMLADANPIERVMSTPTGWLYYYGQTPAQLNTILSGGHYRIVDLQVESATASGPAFTVALVANSGAYAKGWWWYYGQSIAPYVMNGTTYIASVLVPNSGADAPEGARATVACALDMEFTDLPPT